MLSLYIVVLVLTTGVVYPQVDVCSPSQWEGVQQVTQGEFKSSEPTVTQTVTTIAYDLNNTRLAATTRGTKDGQQVANKKIYDYGQATLYSIEGETCQKFKLNSTFRQCCVPANASWSWDVTWYGWSQRMFIYEFKGLTQGLNYYLTWLMNPTPMMEKVYGEIDGVYIYKNTLFANVTKGIANTNVFTPPASCNSVNYSNEIFSTQSTMPGCVSF